MAKQNNYKGKRNGSNRNYSYNSKHSEPDRGNKADSRADSYVGRENDPGWYNSLNTLVTDVTKIPFNTQVGRTLPAQVYDAVDLNVPGVCVLEYLCIPGIAKQASDGVNIAATGLFQTLRKDLSTYAPYASADVMMYVLGMDNIIQAYNVLLRFFGVANLYSSINYNYSNTILEALGLSPAAIIDFRTNMGNYIARFNNLVYKASTIFLPQQFSIIKRHAWLFSNIFIDGDDARSQIYAHKPAGLYILDEEKYETGTALVPVWFGQPAASFGLLLDIFDQMIERFRNSDSMNKIAADMKRAIPGESWRFSYVTSDYLITPVKSTEVLSQIENTTILPSVVHNDNADVTQSVDKNLILFDPDLHCSNFDSTMDEAKNSLSPDSYQVRRVPSELWMTDNLINFHWLNPSSDDIAVATRNMNNIKRVEGENVAKLTSAGSDICVGAYVYKYETSTQSTTNTQIYKYITIGTDDLRGTHTTPFLTDWCSFDWAPQMYLCNSVDGYLTGASPLIEFSNYTRIAPDTLDRIHNNVITSMWSVPQFGTISK